MDWDAVDLDGLPHPVLVKRVALTSLVRRLEAATSRLEDMASSVVEAPKANGSTPALTTLPAAGPPTATSKSPAPKAVAEALPQVVEDLDSLIATTVKKYLDISKEVGGPVEEQALTVESSFAAQRRFILITTKAKKPALTDPVYLELLKPLQDSMTPISHIRDRNRASPFFNHLSTVSESISVFAWLTIDQKPFKHVEECLGAAQYWGNRVVKEYKDKDRKQVEWVQSYYQIFRDLAEYVKQSFPNGLLWNVAGVTPQEALKLAHDAQSASASPATPVAAGGPPPPPPPPPGPAPVFEIDEKPAATTAASGGLGAVFSDLNKGEAVTRGLRKVDPKEMTHKNPSLRAGATVPTRSDSQSSVSSISRGKGSAPGKPVKPESMRIKKPPRMELDGNKWIIENYDNEPQPIAVEVSISHSILISRCNKTTVIVKGKANAISVDNSPRLSLIIDTLVSSVDVIKASNFAMQVTGTLPTILMDQVDGAQIYLSKDSMHTEIFASKSSGVNLNIIESEDGDYKEVALPEQIRTYINKDGKVASEIVEHAG